MAYVFVPVELQKNGKKTTPRNAEEDAELRFDGWLPTGVPPIDHSNEYVRVGDIGDPATPAGKALGAAFVTQGAAEAKYAVIQPKPSRITPPLTASGWTVEASAYFAPNWWITSRFRVDTPTPIDRAVLNIVTSGGNVQVAVLALSGVDHADYVRVLDTGIVPCPVAAQRAVLPFTESAVLYPGDYAVAFWADNTTIVVQHSLSNYLPATGATVGPATDMVDGIPSAGVAEASSGRAIHGISLEGSPWLSLPSVVLLGDSITQSDGWWTLGNAYAGSPTGTVVNAGIGGNTTAGMLARFDTDVTSQSPDVVSVLAGTNDVGQDVPAATIIANLGQLYDLVDGIGAKLFYYPIPPRTATAAQADVLRTVNTWLRNNPRPGAFFVDWSSTLSVGGDETTPDSVAFNDEGGGVYVHPNDVGHQRMAAVLAPKLAAVAV